MVPDFRLAWRGRTPEVIVLDKHLFVGQSGQFVGTRRFSSSNQFSTMVIGAATALSEVTFSRNLLVATTSLAVVDTDLSGSLRAADTAPAGWLSAVRQHAPHFVEETEDERHMCERRAPRFVVSLQHYEAAPVGRDVVPSRLR
jgi:hypothetical protein